MPQAVDTSNIPAVNASDLQPDPGIQITAKDPPQMSDDELAAEAARLGVDKPEGDYGGALHMTIRPQGAGGGKDVSQMSDDELLAEANRLGIGVSRETSGETAPKKDDYDYNAHSYTRNVAHDIGPEFVNDITQGGEQSAEGFKQFVKGVSPAMSDPEAGSPLQRLADMGIGFGKAALGAGGVLGSLVDAPVRAAAANPVQRQTGIPAGLTAFVGDLVAPGAAMKGMSALKSLAPIAEASSAANSGSKLAQLSENSPLKQGFGQDVTGSTAAPAPTPQPEMPMTAGQKTQNPDIQRFEADALAGTQGAKAQGAALNSRANLNQDLQGRIGQMGEIEDEGNPADSVGNAASIIRNNEKSAGQSVNAAYDTARALSENVTIPPQDMAQNLVPKLAETVKNFSIKPETTPKAYSQYQDLGKIIGGDGDIPLQVPMLLDDGETWRRATSQLAAKTTDPADRMALRKLIGTYDDYMSGVAGRATGPAPAINAFKDAVAERADYGRRFEGNDMVESMLDKNSGKSIDDLTTKIVGAGKPGLSTGMLDNVNALMRAAGPEAPKVRASIQNAFAQKIYNFATEKTGNLANSSDKAISPAKLQTALQNVFVRQREMATSVFGADRVKAAQDMISQLGQVTSKQASVGNPSGTAYTERRLADAAKMITKVPGLKWIDGIVSAAKDSASGRDAQAVFSGKTPARFGPKDPQHALKAGVVAAPSEVRHDARNGY